MNAENSMVDDSAAIIIGGGLGGLTCAAYLAVAGRRVLLLEQHDIVGGNSHVFRRRRKYEFDVGVHYLGDCGPGRIIPAILGRLGARDRVVFREPDPDCFDRVVLPGCTVDVPTSWPQYRTRLKLALPDDAEGLDRFVDIIKAIGEEQRATLLAPSVMTITDVIAAEPAGRLGSARGVKRFQAPCRARPRQGEFWRGWPHPASGHSLPVSHEQQTAM